jgi:hypothetical protein
MTRIAITGHRGLPNDVEALVDRALRAELSPHTGSLVGISCLADGADQLFARALLDLGGELEVVVPAARYRDGLPAEARESYDALLSRARRVRRLDHYESTAQSHMDASVEMLKDADLLIAVWDGLPARGLGGTADVVAYARDHGIPVSVIWPEGARRD